MSTLVDSNVLIDVIDSSSPWHAWSIAKLSSARNLGAIVINQVVLAETSEMFRQPSAFEPFALQARLSRENIP